ncbi:Tat pathway signal protein [Phenylobacterium sp. J367]|uniref:Tat pathway signal protein n=1 Tax=Phenylobacterium sp. J367 TaxID=2898435 RepID=UPI0021511736|nr:Tat pathway signal protein [Phenylobacterium sp. J367]MCR5878167.1 Tat pathway signal protein [Phenylobacterium sp. J367]
MRRRALLALIAAAWPAMAAAAGKKEGGEKKRSGGATYIVIQTLTATTNKGGGRRGVFTVECGLDVQDEKLRTLAEQSIPRLRAAYVQVVQAYATGLAPATAPNADFLAQTLQRQTDLVLGKTGAKFLLGAMLVN